MGLINFWGQKSTLDQLDKDLSNLKLYVTHVSGCIAEIDACWIGNKDKEKVVSAISLHLHIVNKSNNDLNIFKQTATFILVKMNELGSLIGLSIPAIANMCFPGLFTEVRIYPRIQIDTAALRTVADKIEGERKYLEETSFSIKNTKNIIDDIILNMNGLGKLLKDLDREVGQIARRCPPVRVVGAGTCAKPAFGFWSREFLRSAFHGFTSGWSWGSRTRGPVRSEWRYCLAIWWVCQR